MNTFDVMIQSIQLVLAIVVYAGALLVFLNAALPSKHKLFK